MALPAIQGASSFFVGANSTYTNATAGGVWSSGDNTILTIDGATGIATGVAEGATQIIYTEGGNSTALNVQINQVGQITNGFNPTLVLGALQNEILWPSQGTSNSGRYFPNFHPICDETILKALCNTGTDYPTFLSSLNKSCILDCVNAVYNKPQLIDKSKLVFQRSDIMLVTQPVMNQDPPQFVGLKFQLAPGDYGIKVSNLMLFFNETITFPIYLYNDFDEAPLYKLMVTTSANQQKIINLQNNVFLNYLTPSINKGGIWYLGYYQADVIAASATAKAIFYPIVINTFHPVVCWSYSAPTFIDSLNQLNFQRQIVGANNLTYGMNLEISTMLDATNDIVENPSLWDNLIGLKMACKVIEHCIFSYRRNDVQSIVQSLGGLDRLNTELNGKSANWQDGSPKIVGLIEKVNDAVQTVKQGFENEFFGGVGLIKVD
jgi:hypothetical protein